MNTKILINILGVVFIIIGILGIAIRIKDIYLEFRNDIKEKKYNKIECVIYFISDIFDFLLDICIGLETDFRNSRVEISILAIILGFILITIY